MDSSYIGAAVGRVANRIGGAQFTLNGTHYKIVANEGNNTLHGTLFSFSSFLLQERKYLIKIDFSTCCNGLLI